MLLGYFISNYVLIVQANGMYLDSQLLYSGGRRVYSDFSSGKWLEQTQVQLLHCSFVVVFLYIVTVVVLLYIVCCFLTVSSKHFHSLSGNC